MTSPLTLVIHPAMEPERLAALQAAAPTLKLVNAADTATALAVMPAADAFFGKITPELLAASKQLRWVQSPTASLEHYLFEDLVKHPCVLTNMRGLFSDVIADQVFGYIIVFARNFQHYFLHQAIRHWEPMGGEGSRVTFSSGPGVITDIDRAHMHLGDCTLGIIGLGSIGSEIARRGRAFSMRIVAVDPQSTKPEEVEELWKPEELDRLLAVSDFVVIAAPHTPKTVKMFRREQFQKMKPSAYLINIGRGALVDLDDLVAAIEADEIAGAGLDVFEVEPLPEEHRLWDFTDRVIITPHVAGYSPRIAARHLAVLVDNVKRFVTGETLRNVVNKELWY